jgi:hypothetical protein
MTDLAYTWCVAILPSPYCSSRMPTLKITPHSRCVGLKPIRLSETKRLKFPPTSVRALAFPWILVLDCRFLLASSQCIQQVAAQHLWKASLAAVDDIKGELNLHSA